MTMPRRVKLRRRTLFHSHRQASYSKEFILPATAKRDFAEAFLLPSEFFRKIPGKPNTHTYGFGGIGEN